MFSRLIKHFAAFLGALSFAVLSVTGFYSSSLPDSYSVPLGGSLMLNSTPAVSAKSTENCTAAIVANDGQVSQSTLMLFDSIPIKNVTSKAVSRPLLVPCGQAFGIKIVTDGVMVVDFNSINGVSPAKSAGICKGDVIVSINGTKVKSNSDVAGIIARSMGQACQVVLRRDSDERQVTLKPVLDGGRYKAGMWVRDSSAGIGTLTFYDPSTGCFGGLGHPVCDSDTGEVLSISKGSVGDIKITGCTKSVKGNPGQLTGEFATSASLGSIFRNCSEGLFGTLAANPSDENEVELAFRQEVHTGEAEILCSVDGGEAQRYSIVIEQVNLSENAEHDLVVRVTDSRLIEKTGGIVQGMSGSPIIQDGRLAGAVTHVFVDNPEMGYGIFAEDMYECETSVAEKFSDMAG